MARYRPVSVEIWNDEIFEEYSPEGKLIFLFLVTNPFCTESGIYKITHKKIADFTGISIDKIKDIFNKELLGDEETLKGNVFYDDENKFVFVKNFLKYNGRGSKELLSKSLSNDKSNTSQRLWNIFEKIYPSYLNNIFRSRSSYRSSSDNNKPTKEKEENKDTFDSFWDEYHKITGKQKTDKNPALKHYKRLTIKEKTKAFENIKPYFKSLSDKKYCKKARTYLRDKNFNDEFTPEGESRDKLKGEVKPILEKVGYDIMAKKIWDEFSIHISNWKRFFEKENINTVKKVASFINNYK